jgi:ubiquinone/menaquinone biosynthesis C-methylase UbiE
MPLERILEPEVMDTPEEAREYDAMDHCEVNARFVDDLLATVAREGIVPPAERPQLDVLDLGTGTALIPIVLCTRCAGCRVMAADAAVYMLELARYNVEVHSLTGRIELAPVDAKALPFRDGLFDVVMSNSIVHHIPEPLGVLREAVRVAAPGGLLFFRDLLRPPDAAELDRLVATHAAEATPGQRQLLAQSLHAALSLGEIRELVAALGYAPETVRVTSDRHWTWAARKRT